MTRKTQQRQAIFAVMQAEKRPLSVLEVLELAQKTCPGLGVATVYRNLKALLLEEKIVSVDMTGGQILYELAKQKPHHHFSCVSCEKVFDVVAFNLDLKTLIPAGFQLQQHDILMSGFCNICSK